MARQSVMVRQVCTLVPFDRSNCPEILVSAEVIWRQNGGIELSYGLRSKCKDSLNGLLLKPKSEITRRSDELWKHSCFEAFICWPNHQKYWELNVSPCGDWNLYSLEKYRKGMRTQSINNSPRINVHRSSMACHCNVLLELDPWCPDKFNAPKLGLAVVLEESNRALSYWAILHNKDSPDFHDKSCFLQL